MIVCTVNNNNINYYELFDLFNDILSKTEGETY